MLFSATERWKPLTCLELLAVRELSTFWEVIFDVKPISSGAEDVGDVSGVRGQVSQRWPLNLPLWGHLSGAWWTPKGFLNLHEECLSIRKAAVCLGIPRFTLKERKKPGAAALNCHSGMFLVFKAGCFQDVIRADFWMCGLVVFRVCYRTWQMITAASQYEIWILVSRTAGIRRITEMCYVMMSWLRTCWHWALTDTPAVISPLSSFSPPLLRELCPFSSVAIATWAFDWHTCPSNQQHTGLGCRRSSSDAAYELAETVRAQRECRLRPHYSDPMPADASKRKQLEMKIAAAARLHSHRRDRDRDRDRDSGEYRTHVGQVGLVLCGFIKLERIQSSGPHSLLHLLEWL